MEAYQIYGWYKDEEYGQDHEWQNQDSNISAKIGMME